MGMTQSDLAGSPRLDVDDRIAPGTPVACCCCYPLTGIPQDAILLPMYEQEELIAKMQGVWKIMPLDGGSHQTVMYTQAYVEGNKYSISGGTHRTKHGSAPNTPQTYYLKFYRRGRVLYADHIGTIVESITETEFKFRPPVGNVTRAVWVRDGPVDCAPLHQATLAEELEKLAQLKASGALTEEEFTAAKAQVLHKM